MKVIFLGDCITEQHAGIKYFALQWVKRVIKRYPQHEYALISTKKIEDLDLEQIICPVNSSIPFHYRLRSFTVLPKAVDDSGADLCIELAHFGPFRLPDHIKRATMIHDITPITHPLFHPRTSVWAHKLLLKGIVKRSDYLITNSHTTKGEIVKKYGKNPKDIFVNYPKIFVPTQEVLSSNSILAIGTIEPRKDQITLLKAFEKVCQRDDEVILEIIGGTGWKNQNFWSHFNNLNENVKKRIKIHTEMSRPKLIQRLNACRMFVSTSLAEGFGIPTLEAMSIGKPLLLSDIPINREVGDDAARYFNVKNHDQLASIITEILSNVSLENDLKVKSEKRLEFFKSDRMYLPFLKY